MVMIRTANKPIAFQGQIVAYDHDSTYQEKEIFDTDTKELTSNPNTSDTFYYNNATGTVPTRYFPVDGKVIFEPEGTSINPQVYRLKH